MGLPPLAALATIMAVSPIHGASAMTKATTKTADAMKASTELMAITPMLAVADVPKAAAFYQKFGLETVATFPGPDGAVQRLVLRHGDTQVHVAPARALPEEGAHGRAIEKGPRGLGMVLYLRVTDVDARHKQALAAGATQVQAPRDESWGDRVSRVLDPFGFDWCFASPARPAA
ncbi:MAG: hypothetical protein QOJ26_1630 [Thermoplasmata archaeon]|jgi:PhnB protein|nr:hypothetical protein [Thermoplasmata archaeon]